MIAEGNTTKKMAKRMGVTEKPVEAHRSKLMKTLKTRSIAGLVRFAMRSGAITP